MRAWSTAKLAAVYSAKFGDQPVTVSLYFREQPSVWLSVMRGVYSERQKKAF